MIKVLPVSHSNLALLIFLILFASVGAFAQPSIHSTPNLFNRCDYGGLQMRVRKSGAISGTVPLPSRKRNRKLI
jgi:hypothetical protein